MGKQPLPDLTQVKRLLIIRMSAIGDVIHALPLSVALKEAHPHLEITWIVEEIPADVVHGNPFIDRVLVIPRTRWNKGRWTSPEVWREYFAFLKELRSYQFDVTIDLQGYGKSALLALAAGAKHRIGWWRMRDGAHLVSQPLARRLETVHRVDWFLDVARALGVEVKNVQFPLHIPNEAHSYITDLLCKHDIELQEPFIVVNQAAGNIPRRWGKENYAQIIVEIAEKFQLPVVLVGTQPEVTDNEWIVDVVTKEFQQRKITNVLKPLNLAGKTNLKQLAALLEKCALHICGDTGSAHIAAGLKRPVVAFYGSTDPNHAGPWKQRNHVVERRKLCHMDCTVRSCAYVKGGTQHIDSPKRNKRAPAVQLPDHATSRCLANISVEEAMEKISQVLNGEI